MTSPTMDDAAAAPGRVNDDRSLTYVEGGIIVAVAVTHFLFASGPIWRHPWSPNANILWSYAPIPFMVAIALLRGKRLRFGTWAMGTFGVMVTKFVITAFVLVGLWAATSPPAPITVTPPPPAEPAEIALNSSETVVVPQGAVAPRYVGDTTDLKLALGPGAKSELRVPIGAPLAIVSGDGHMHTLVAPSLGLNMPIVSGAKRTVVFAPGSAETIDFACGVHPSEPHTLVVVTR
jgi:hypothetical protein